jgi:hypothetical protein
MNWNIAILSHNHWIVLSMFRRYEIKRVEFRKLLFLVYWERNKQIAAFGRETKLHFIPTEEFGRSIILFFLFFGIIFYLRFSSNMYKSDNTRDKWIEWKNDFTASIYEEGMKMFTNMILIKLSMIILNEIQRWKLIEW